MTKIGRAKFGFAILYDVKGNERMLNKKTALLSAQVTTAPDAAATVEGSAGVEVQADPAAQIEPIQSAPATTQQ